MIAKIVEGTEDAILRYAHYHIRVNVVYTEWEHLSRVVNVRDAIRLLGLSPVSSPPKTLDRFLPKRVLKQLTGDYTHVFEPIRFIDGRNIRQVSFDVRGLYRVASAVVSTHHIKARHRVMRECCKLFDDYRSKIDLDSSIDKATRYKIGDKHE